MSLQFFYTKFLNQRILLLLSKIYIAAGIWVLSPAIAEEDDHWQHDNVEYNNNYTHNHEHNNNYAHNHEYNSNYYHENTSNDENQNEYQISENSHYHNNDINSNYHDARDKTEILRQRIEHLEQKIQDLEKNLLTLARQTYNHEPVKKREEFQKSDAAQKSNDSTQQKSFDTDEKLNLAKTNLDNKSKDNKLTKEASNYNALVAKFKDLNTEKSNQVKKNKAIELKSAFEKFIDNNSNSNKAADAHFWLAETYYILINLNDGKNPNETKDYLKNASLSYIQSFKSTKIEEKKPLILFKLADISNKLDENEVAIKMLDKIKADYPKNYQQMNVQIDNLKKKILTKKKNVKTPSKNISKPNIKPNSTKVVNKNKPKS